MSKKGTRSTRDSQDAWITEYIQNGHNAKRACEKLKIAESTYHRWKKGDPQFVARLDERTRAIAETVTKVVRANTEGMLEQALAAIRREITNPFGDAKVALSVMAALDPDHWDPAMRKLLRERQLDEQGGEVREPEVYVVEGDELPERLRPVPEKAEGE